MSEQSDMVSKTADPGARCLLAPLPLPVNLDGAVFDGTSPLFYLSWAGWELYLARRLALKPGPGAPTPLLLPDMFGPAEDFAAIEQLVRTAGELGAGVLSLPGRAPESLPGLIGSIRSYPGLASERPGPILDDRSYLALWAVTEYQARQSDRLLAETAAKEQAMWSALKGEEISPAEFNEAPSAEPDRRTLYAWQCWRRLAAPLMLPSDIIVPNAPEAGDDA